LTEQIKKAIENFKEKNGNEHYTEKDLLMYIVQRMDNLPCNEHLKTMYNIKAGMETNARLIKHWQWTAGILLTLILTIIGLSYAL